MHARGCRMRCATDQLDRLVRLLGVGVSSLAEGDEADPADLVNQRAQRIASVEHAMDRVRKKFGDAAMIKGLSLDEDE